MYKKQKHYSYLTDDNNKRKKAKGTKKCVIKIKLKFENYEIYLEATQLENKINHLEKKQIMWVVLEKILKNHQNQYINIKITAKI